MWSYRVSYVLRILPSKIFLFPQLMRPHMCMSQVHSDIKFKNFARSLSLPD